MSHVQQKIWRGPCWKGTAPEGIREKLERSGSTASKTEQQASSLTSDPRSARRQLLVATFMLLGLALALRP